MKRRAASHGSDSHPERRRAVARSSSGRSMIVEAAVGLELPDPPLAQHTLAVGVDVEAALEHFGEPPAPGVEPGLDRNQVVARGCTVSIRPIAWVPRALPPMKTGAGKSGVGRAMCWIVTQASAIRAERTGSLDRACCPSPPLWLTRCRR